MTYQIVTVETGVVTSGRLFKAKSPEEYAELRKRHKYLELPEKQDDLPDWWTGKFVGTFADVEALANDGIECTIKRVRGVYAETLPNQLGTQTVTTNNVVIPSVGLFAVTHLKVLENECTNYVQSWLDRGWRIVAVCPPNDTRRPTFILGHIGEPK